MRNETQLPLLFYISFYVKHKHCTALHATDHFFANETTKLHEDIIHKDNRSQFFMITPLQQICQEYKNVHS